MSQDPLFSEEELEAARVLFARQASFLMGAVSVDGLPPGDLPMLLDCVLDYVPASFSVLLYEFVLAGRDTAST